jgi:hypothetical protein
MMLCQREVQSEARAKGVERVPGRVVGAEVATHTHTANPCLCTKK